MVEAKNTGQVGSLVLKFPDSESKVECITISAIRHDTTLIHSTISIIHFKLHNFKQKNN